MTTYGYRVAELFITRPRKQTPRIALTEPEAAGGLYQAVFKAANDALARGEKDEVRRHYTRISQVRADAWGILLTVKGGDYGEPREVIDVDADETLGNPRSIGQSDAVLSAFYSLLIIPPYGESGLLITEVKGRSHLQGATLRQLNYKLRDLGVFLRITSDAVDGHAWSEFLADDAVGVTGVELVQSTPSPDRTRFTSENVRRSWLHLDLENGSQLKAKVVNALRAMIGQPDRRPRLVGLVGLRDFDDEDFDEERIITVRDGKERKLDVRSSWPRFTYQIDTEERLTAAEFVDEVASTARDALTFLNVDVAANWRPVIDD
ncbi:hypothetical protein [Amycolatopsis circi]|uniref:hypothetical protein n=1 Tax=Amycolatopsis circi TaxID=871959 RepID=UPI0013BE8E8E|nr:hypothetical protein [Amycolatopsis circi]